MNWTWVLIISLINITTLGVLYLALINHLSKVRFYVDLHYGRRLDKLEKVIGVSANRIYDLQSSVGRIRAKMDGRDYYG